MAKYNIIAKTIPNKEYIITEMIATNLTKEKFLKIQKLNGFLKDYKFINFKDTDFTWWQRITKFLTQSKLYKNCYFDIDFYGNITKY